MIELHTLGRLELAGAPGDGFGLVIAQPKRAGMLVYLALAEPRGFHRRDSLVALFWPEMDTAKARQSLRQVVYMLRRAMGKDAVLSRGDEELALNRELVRSDVTAFEEAIRAGNPEAALEMYAGDFLAGFFVSGAAPEFDEWVANQRRRLRTMAAESSWAVGLEEEKANNAAGAAHWARRAVGLTPDDEEATRDLMLLLARVGDRSGALRAYDQLAARLRSEFDALPSPELSKLALALRSGAEAYVPAARPLPGREPGLTSLDPLRPVQSRVRRRAWWIAGVVAALVISAAVSVTPFLRSSPVIPVFAVGEIRDFTRSDSTEQAGDFADLLATSIARLAVEVVGSPRLYDIRGQGLAIDSRFTLAEAARSAGAGILLEGDLKRTGSALVLEFRFVDLGSGRIRQGVKVTGSDPFDLADRAADLLAARFGIAPPAQALSEITTTSLIALRLYEQGLSAYYSADFGAGQRLFSAALEEDSSFSMAAFFLAKAAVVLGDPKSVEYSAIADRLASRATDHDRLLIKGTTGQWSMLPAARAYAETLAVRYPSDVDGQLVLGQTRSWTGDYAGAAEAYRNVIRIDSLSLNRKGVLCRACEAYGGLVSVYQSRDSLESAVRVAREWVERAPRSPLAVSMLVAALEGAGEYQEYFMAGLTLDTLLNRKSRFEFARAWIALKLGQYATAETVLNQLIASSEADAGEYRWYLTITLWQQGRLREALALTERMGTGQASELLRAQTLFLGGRGAEAGAAFATLAAAADPVTDGMSARHKTWNLTHAATAFAVSGDTVRVVALADTVEQSGARSLFGRDTKLHHYVRGLLARSRGDYETAERELRLAVDSWNMGYTRINYELGRVLLELGRPQEAVRVLQPAFRGSLEASNLYITRTELHELLARAWDGAGNRDSARAHWRAVVDAWRGADPEFQARWQAALAALAR